MKPRARKLQATLWAALLCIALPGEHALASPLFEFQCLANTPVGPLPESIEFRYTMRRHWHNGEPLTEISNEFWGEATYSSGEMEVEVPLIGGGSIRETSVEIATTLLDGKNGLRDVFEDLAVVTTQVQRTEGFWIKSFGLNFQDEDGTAWDTHLEFPETFDLSVFEDSVCQVFYRDGRDLGSICAPDLDCNIGFVRGDIAGVVALPHLHDHEGQAIEINTGMNDAWVSADAPFQGMFITAYPSLNLLFLAWFTFDSEVPVGETAVVGAADQRWVTGAGEYAGNTAAINVELTSGGIFNGSDPLAVQSPGYGTITIVFKSCNEAELTYNFPGPGLSGTMTITRALTDNVALCEALGIP